jgi:MATE family multidrug resistance protein
MVEVGIVRGLCHTKMITLGGFIGFFLISLPLSVVFCFHLNYGVYGLWLGLLFGSLFLCFYNKWLLNCYLDWDKITEE